MGTSARNALAPPVTSTQVSTGNDWYWDFALNSLNVPPATANDWICLTAKEFSGFNARVLATDDP